LLLYLGLQRPAAEGKNKAKNEPPTAAIRPPFSLGKSGETRVNILAKPGAKLSAITGISEVRILNLVSLSKTKIST
jgi:hypothetical protein